MLQYNYLASSLGQVQTNVNKQNAKKRKPGKPEGGCDMKRFTWWRMEQNAPHNARERWCVSCSILHHAKRFMSHSPITKCMASETRTTWEAIFKGREFKKLSIDGSTHRSHLWVNEFGSVVAKGHRLAEGPLERILRHHRSNCRVVENASVPR